MKYFFVPNSLMFWIRLAQKREEREEHANAKRYALHAKGIKCCLFFDQTGNIDETVQRQHLNQYINIYLHRKCR